MPFLTPCPLCVFSVAYKGELLCMVWVLLDHGVTVNSRAHDGSTPLHHAASLHCEELSETLLRHGACMTIPWKQPSAPNSAR